MSAQQVFRRFGWFSLAWGTLLVISAVASLVLSGLARGDTSMQWMYLIAVLPIPFIGYGLLRNPDGIRFACNLYVVMSVVLVSGLTYRNISQIALWEEVQPGLIEFLDPYKRIFWGGIVSGVKQLWFPLMVLWLYRLCIDLQPLSERATTRKLFTATGFFMCAWGILSIPSIDPVWLDFSKWEPNSLTAWMWISFWTTPLTVVGYLVMGIVLIKGDWKPAVLLICLLLLIFLDGLRPIVSLRSSVLSAADLPISNPLIYSYWVHFSSLAGVFTKNGLVLLILFFNWTTLLPDATNSLRHVWRMITNQQPPDDSQEQRETNRMNHA